MPKALAVTLRVGGACWRLYSAAFTMRTVRRTRDGSSAGGWRRFHRRRDFPRCRPSGWRPALRKGAANPGRSGWAAVPPRAVFPGRPAGMRSADAIDVARQGIHGGFGNVGDDGQAARHVAVKRAISHRQFGFVPRGQQQRAKLIGKRHQDVAANARLDVLLRHVARRAVKGGVEGFAGNFQTPG